MTRKALDKALRRKLESTVVQARDIAELAATEAVERLGIGNANAPDYLDDDERQLRKHLRAHGRQLGDDLQENGSQGTRWLIREIAYSHWHRMLFARFLEQNDLLMYDSHIHVTLEECAELAADEGCADGWELASILAAKMLPQIFRPDSPVYRVKLAINHVRSLEKKLTGLVPETFQAQDALGWVYQFWQIKRKAEVNKSEVKIGAKELSPVTQLFTEPYMVSFLLDNALGAWWAHRRLNENDKLTAKTEDELRRRASIDGVPLSYLRFVKQERTGEETDTEGDEWVPAAGTFDQWPENLSELKTLDPCCGSGHFLVAAFLMLVPMRMTLENLSVKEAIDLVLSQNIHGLELDQRCVELAAFALALEAWRYPDAGGYRPLPELHLACTGLSIKAAKDEWKQLGLGKNNLRLALDALHQTFENAPVLGSLINPKKSDAAKLVQWDELSKTLDTALSSEQDTEKKEVGIVAQGLAKSAMMLADEYHWVMTNVPYLVRGKQTKVLREYSEKNYSEAKNDLATVFLDRCLDLCKQGGITSTVLPQNWLFLSGYKKIREKLLQRDTWNLLTRLGAGAFDTIGGEVVQAILLNLTKGNEKLTGKNILHSLDVSEFKTPSKKSLALKESTILLNSQMSQLDNPGFRISLKSKSQHNLLSSFASYHNGVQTGDFLMFGRKFWEVSELGFKWVFHQSTVDLSCHYGGMDTIFLWEKGEGVYIDFLKERLGFNGIYAWLRGQDAWGKLGVCVRGMGNLPVSRYMGGTFDNNVTVIIPKEGFYIDAITTYLESDQYQSKVREINQKLSVTDSSFVDISFDLDYWQKISKEKYPLGLPEPYSNDPTQWIFCGHPCGSVIWDEQDKWTMKGTLRIDDTVLQVAVARLLGYQWPTELDETMELANEQREWVKACASLNTFADDDGIACLPALRGEKPAADRLEALLQAAYGDAWSANVLSQLLASVKAKTLEGWLRDKFFEQHCKLFQSRPFIWHIWDGLPDGFSALVNYHQFDDSGLGRLIYTYLNGWIQIQEHGVHEGMAGADLRLQAAKALRAKLVAIAEGEHGLDIFVRWKSLAEQPMGWQPDLNDGVRLNIRPFIRAGDVGKKDAGILRAKPSTIQWKKDRGKDVASAPWFHLGPVYGGKSGDRINDHHLTLADKQAAREAAAKKPKEEAPLLVMSPSAADE